MNKEVIICVGISGSSKSTWAAQFIKDNPNYLRINRDDIRKTLVGNLDGYYQRNDLNKIEDLINKLEISYFYMLFNTTQYNLIVDNTHLKQSYIEKWVGEFKQYEEVIGFKSYNSKVNFKFKLFDISLEEAKNRVLNRDFEGIEYSSKGDLYLESCLEKIKYIDKQWLQYKEIKRFIYTNYKDKII